MASFGSFLKQYFPMLFQGKTHAMVIEFPVKVNHSGIAKTGELLKLQTARHLVIYRLKITCKCGVCSTLKGGEYFLGRSFPSLAIAESYRSSVKRLTGNEARLISSATACEQFAELAASFNPFAPGPMVDFLSEHFERAASPALN
jgi:hypothetical protein